MGTPSPQHREDVTTETFVLYGSPHSQFTYKVALLLRMSGVSFSFRYVSFQKGMHRTPEFRALSRWGEVPVLRHAGRVLTQSGAILEYLAETLGTFAGPASSRQVIREWLFWDADRFARPIYGCYGVKLGQLGLLPITIDPAIAGDDRRRAEAALGTLDTNLDGGEFLVGGDATIADICCCAEVAFARMSDFDLSRWERVERWMERLAELPGFAHPLDLLPMANAEFV